jgi:hypothetical protein
MSIVPQLESMQQKFGFVPSPRARADLGRQLAHCPRISPRVSNLRITYDLHATRLPWINLPQPYRHRQVRVRLRRVVVGHRQPDWSIRNRKLNGNNQMMIKTLATLALLSLSAVSASAGTRADGCTKEPQANWMKAEMVEVKAKEAGYTVSKSKVAGTCYEVYATKGEKRFELFYNPMTAELVEEVVK